MQYKSKKAFENLLISTAVKENEVSVYIVNDNFDLYYENLFIELVDFKGNVLWSDKKLVSVEENENKKVHNFDIKYKIIDTKKIYLRVKFVNETSIFYLKKPKNLLLEKSKIIKSIKKWEDGFLILLESKTLQKDVFLYTEEKRSFQ